MTHRHPRCVSPAEACIDAIDCRRCGAKRRTRCPTDRQFHLERWDTWAAYGFGTVP
jgi:hypothetical protein